MKKSNLEKYFEVLIQIEMFKTKKDNVGKTVAERREAAIEALKEDGKIYNDYE
jgi:hypothetical protein